MPETTELLTELRAAGLVGAGLPAIRPLAGGVSSDIVLVEDGPRRFVVKRALARLRVKDEWLADVSRNRTERAWFAYASRVVPEAVPKILHADPQADWFAMEFLADEWTNWKQELLAGRIDPAVARRAGGLLGRLHAASWNDPAARAQFETGRSFHDLRIAPYLLATADRVGPAAAILRAEADRLAGTRLALVHGDYSPKNLLVAPGRLIILDAEVAWFGDPALDAAFLLNHLLLKALRDAPHAESFLALATGAWAAYVASLGSHASADLEARTTRLLLCLMLARVHGKSPVEYLDGARRGLVTAFVLGHLPAPPPSLSGLLGAWRRALGGLTTG
jgi:aminoglycoside phosphotransferase (APT) family kinase protein